MKTITPDQLAQKFKNIKNETPDEIVKSMKKAILIGEGAAKAECPVRTGNLRRTTTEKGVQKKGNSIIGTIGSDAEYAAAVHEGTSKRSANPYILRGLQASEKEIEECLKQGVTFVLRKG
jgi:HK97 gp10 family phage protein